MFFLKSRKNLYVAGGLLALLLAVGLKLWLFPLQSVRVFIAASSVDSKALLETWNHKSASLDFKAVAFAESADLIVGPAAYMAKQARLQHLLPLSKPKAGASRLTWQGVPLAVALDSSGALRLQTKKAAKSLKEWLLDGQGSSELLAFPTDDGRVAVALLVANGSLGFATRPDDPQHFHSLQLHLTDVLSSFEAMHAAAFLHGRVPQECGAKCVLTLWETGQAEAILGRASYQGKGEEAQPAPDVLPHLPRDEWVAGVGVSAAPPLRESLEVFLAAQAQVLPPLALAPTLERAEDYQRFEDDLGNLMQKLLRGRLTPSEAEARLTEQSRGLVTLL